MDRLSSPLNFTCPLHTSQKIQGVDPNLSAEKQTYCLICIIKSKPQNADDLYESLQTLSGFLDSAATSFANTKATIKPNSNRPQEYMDFLSNKAEALNRMTNHINQQKKKVESSIEVLKDLIIQILDQKKAEFLKKLDEEVTKLNDEYGFFEKELRMNYPCQEDIDRLFPTRQELENRYQRVETADQCELFIRKIKQELQKNGLEISRSTLNDQEKKSYLDCLKKELQNFDNIKPIIEIIQPGEIDEVKKALEQHIKASMVLKNSIKDEKSEDFVRTPNLFLIKSWLPEQYKNDFSPKLIYKGVRDGMDPKAFHSKCDGKGPTITFIKCMFTGSSEMTVIGGFLDKDWHKNNSNIESNEAFLFSLTSRIKCPHSGSGRAAHGSSSHGPIFGNGSDLIIDGDLKNSFVSPTIYSNAAQIVHSPIYHGSGRIKFTPYDIEVYTIKP